MADRKQNQRADDLREAVIGQDGRKNTSLQHNSATKSTPFASRKRITTAAGLSFSETLAVMDEATELPPFGFNIAILEQRLERRLGFEVTKSAINECLMPYYNLREWQERYVMTALGTEVEDFPGKGSGNHPPLSPLKEFDLRSDADKSEEDMEGQGGRKLGLAAGASPTRERNSPRSGNASDHNGNNGGVDSCDMALD